MSDRDSRNMKQYLCGLFLSLAVSASGQSAWWGHYDGTAADTLAFYSFESETLYTNGTSVYSAVVPDQPDRTWDAYYSEASATCSFGAGGRIRNGLHVPGGNNVASKCATHNGSNIFPVESDPSLTLECWVLFEDDAALQFLISKGNAWSTQGGYDLWFDDGYLKSAFADSNTNGMQISVGWVPTVGTWHHVASTWNAADDTARLYVDGIELTAKSFPGSSIIDHPARTLAIGQRALSGYYGLNGIIDEVRISRAAYTFERADLPKRSTYPAGDKFWFSFYSTLDDDTEYALERGATGMGPYYGSATNQFHYYDWSDAHHVNISRKVRLDCMEGAVITDSSYVWPDDETIVADAVKAVTAARYNPNIMMWDIHPEELRFWKADELNYLTLVSDVIRQMDPFGRPIMMYEPKHRTASDLARTIPYQDICAKGIYVNLVDNGAFRHNRIWARWSIEQELQAIASANTNAVPWITLLMYADEADDEKELILDWCRHDAYLGLILGGKGISIWSGYRPRSGFENDFQTYLDSYLTVASELNLEKNFAPVFLYGAETPGITHAVTTGPATLELIYGGETNSYPPVAYTLREFLGQQYLFAVNSATQTVTLTFSGVPDAPRTDLFQGLETPASGGSFSQTFDPYEVVAFRFDGYETWQTEHFTARQILDGDAAETADPDGDGRTNRDEFAAGTDPNLGTDFFSPGLTFSNAWKTVSFSTSSNRFYNVDRSTNLVSGSWVPMVGNEQGSGAEISVTDTNDHPNAFYRTRVTRP